MSAASCSRSRWCSRSVSSRSSRPANRYSCAGSTSSGASGAQLLQRVQVRGERLGLLVPGGDVGRDARQHVVAGEQQPVGLVVEAQVPGRVAGRPHRAQPQPGHVDQVAVRDQPVGPDHRRRGPSPRWRCAAPRPSSARCAHRAHRTSAGTPAIAPRMSGRANLASSASSPSCMPIHAPDASRTAPDRPWWSGCTWVTSTAVTALSGTAARGQAVGQRLPARRGVPAGVDEHEPGRSAR